MRGWSSGSGEPREYAGQIMGCSQTGDHYALFEQDTMEHTKGTVNNCAEVTGITGNA